jgi:hypothetical protein
MSWNDVNFNNLTVKFTKAMQKTLKDNKDGSPKTVHGYSWSHLSGVQDMFRNYATKINLHEKFKSIMEHTNIKSMKLEYNGYGDDGCLENVEFRDENGMQIHPSHIMRNFYMHTKHDENVKPNTVMNYSLWESDEHTRSLRKYIDQRKQCLMDMEPEAFATMDLEDWSNGVIQSVLHMGWSIHEIKTLPGSDERAITLCRTQSYVYDEFTHFDTRVLQLMYPRVRKDEWENIDEAFYQMLQPGWQNNNGSQNCFKVEFDKNKVKLNINQETNVMVQESEETEVILDETLSKRFQGFLKDIFPNKKQYEDVELDISLKKDQPKLKQLHDFISNMLDEKVERKTEREE